MYIIRVFNIIGSKLAILTTLSILKISKLASNGCRPIYFYILVNNILYIINVWATCYK